MMISSRRASLLVVLAHPDDELFHGGMLSYLSERGVRVTLACATNGAAGKPHPSVGSVDELRLSCDRLGIDPPCFWASTIPRAGNAGGTATLAPWQTSTCSKSKRRFDGSSKT